MTDEQTIHCRCLLTPQGWLDDAILKLDAEGMVMSVEVGEASAAAHRLRGLVIPGMPNLHSHAFQRLMAGLAGSRGGAEDSFWTWREEMYRLANRITPPQNQAVAAWLQVEMLAAGYTSCAEFHYLHNAPGGGRYEDLAEMSGRIMAAAEQSGIALTLMPVLYCRSGFGAADVGSGQARFRLAPQSFLELLDLCRQRWERHSLRRVGVAPHSLRAVSPEDLNEVLPVAAAAGLPVHIHAAEQPAEVEQCLAHLGARPVDWLLAQQEVGPRWCLVHATHMAPTEAGAAAASGAVAGLCPTTEADLGDGFFETHAWLKARGRFGIGSDSNLRLSVCEELRLLENEARLRSGRRNVLARPGQTCGRSLYEAAAAGGAQALGQPVGALQPGRRADLVELDTEHPLMDGRGPDDALNTWVFAGGSAMIRSVWVAGRRVLEQGHHEQEEPLRDAFRRAVRELAT
ncbi:MAG: formimidoylglutamate deiminase [Lysobacterales bacterium]|jgi:formimidoylglutamate deiminase